jgi:hypothetical protein
VQGCSLGGRQGGVDGIASEGVDEAEVVTDGFQKALFCCLIDQRQAFVDG